MLDFVHALAPCSLRNDRMLFGCVSTCHRLCEPSFLGQACYSSTLHCAFTVTNQVRAQSACFKYTSKPATCIDKVISGWNTEQLDAKSCRFLLFPNICMHLLHASKRYHGKQVVGHLTVPAARTTRFSFS